MHTNSTTDILHLPKECKKMPKTLLVLVLLFISMTAFKAQNLEGISGLFFIPTADMQHDGQITLGANFMNKSLVSFSKFQRDAVTPFLNCTFLPFIEVGGRITRLINSNISTQGIGDRTISIRVRLYYETKFIPSLLVGLHDLKGVNGGSVAVHNNALYFVASKNIHLNELYDLSVGLHLGWGTDKILAWHHNFVGLFGGLSIKPAEFFEFILEYDAVHTNSGIRINILDHFKILAGFLQLKYFSGGVAINFKL